MHPPLFALPPPFFLGTASSSGGSGTDSLLGHTWAQNISFRTKILLRWIFFSWSCSTHCPFMAKVFRTKLVMGCGEVLGIPTSAHPSRSMCFTTLVLRSPFTFLLLLLLRSRSANINTKTTLLILSEGKRPRAAPAGKRGARKCSGAKEAKKREKEPVEGRILWVFFVLSLSL